MNNWLRKKQASSPAKASAFAVLFLLLIVYGLYIQTQDFHPKGGFQRHRKVLLDTTDQALSRSVAGTHGSISAAPRAVKDTDTEKQEVVQQESEQLQLPASHASKLTETDQISSSSTGGESKTFVEKSSEGKSHLAQDAVQKAGSNVKGVSGDTDYVLPSQGGQDAKQRSVSVQILLDEPVTEVEGSHHTESKSKATNSPNRVTAAANSAWSKSTAAFTKLPSFEEKKASYESKSGTTTHGASSMTDEAEWRKRQALVKKAVVESWAAYEQYAMGADELAPLTLASKDSVSFGGMAASLIDALDTLWMMDMKAEFGRARDWLDKNLTFDKRSKISLFETTIRIIGGMLSAYDLSGDKMFLDKSQELADKLMPSLNTTKSGIPTNVVQFNAAPGEFKRSEIGRAALAEFGSIQLEFLALSQRCSNATYGEKAEALIKVLHDNYPEQGLLPVWFNRKQAKFIGNQLYTVGAMADSYFEYLLKLWLLHQKQVEMYRSMWERAIDETLDQLVYISQSGLTFIGQKRNRGMFSGKMEHLACYLPGNMALGVAEGALGPSKGAYYLEVAANLTNTCYQMYNRTKTGLGLDVVMFTETAEMLPKVSKNVLRPETVESLFYMWRVTGDNRYREWGWTIFQAFQTYSRTPEGAFAAIKDVNVLPVQQEDTMESFWIAETLKYLWLLFGPDELFSLSDWVLNTEAHPFRISLATHV